MLNPSPMLRRFEARYARENVGEPFQVVLGRFAALWAHARLLNPQLGADWAGDLEADRRIARAVNGLPPTS